MKKTTFKNLPDETTPINEDNLNKMQDDIEEGIRGQAKVVTVSTAIKANTNYTIPFSYTVGSNELEVKYMGWSCTKDVDFAEVGDVGTSSNKVQFGWQIEKNEILEFRKRG